MAVSSRYIGGVPYGPGMGVGRYPNRASVGTMPGVVQVPTPGVGGAGVRGGGDVVAPQVAWSTGDALSAGGAGGGGGGNNMLLAAALGALPLLGYLPDAIDWIDRQFSETPAQAAQAPPSEWAAWDAGSFAGPGGVQIPNAALGGFGSNWGQVFEPGTMSIDPVATQALLDAPMPAGDQFAGLAGDVASANGAGLGSGLFAGQGYDFGLTGSLGSLPGFGDVAVGLADAAGGLAGAYGSQTAVNARNPNSGYGHQIGSTLGGILGSFIPVPFIGTAVGSMMGGALGAEIGDSMGAPPTVGRNFSSFGTFGGDGTLSWGNSGGDNGGSAADADPFATWFGQNLLQQAAAQGYGFNPNMAGAQVRVGGYDNFSRTARSPAGGYFYDITNAGGQFGGSPENYALRPSDDFAGDPFSGRQADAFTQAALADLIARGVFTQGGAAGQDQSYLGSTLGAGYGWYGAPGSNYNTFEFGGSGGFGDMLGGRQNAITGYLNEQQRIAQESAARNNTYSAWSPDAGQTWGAYDLSQPIFANGGMINPGDIAFPGQAAAPPAQAPMDLYQGALDGTQGVQWTENGPIFASVGGAGGAQVPAGWNLDGGA